MTSARRSISLISAVVVLTAASASAQIGDAKCADKANNFGRKVSSAQNKESRKCVKDEGKGNLMTTVEACLTADTKDKVQKKKDKVDDQFDVGGFCEGLEFTDLVTGANVINVAHQGESINLIHDIFGPDLDAGQILQTVPERTCQDKLAKRTGQMFDAWLSEFRKCKKNAMNGGATTTADVVTACLSATGVDGTGSALPDPKDKIDKKGQSLADDIQGACLDESLDTDTMAPGDCVGGGVQGDFTKCMQDLAECRACKAVKTADNLSTVNCDLVDNGQADQSCPQPGCEILNDVECFLPYPSSQFLVPDPTTDTGLRVSLPAEGMPPVNGPDWLPDAYNQLDGFNPMVQILMHFPQGLDLALSDAARLLAPGCCGQPAGPPWIDTRTYTERSLDADSPSVLMKADTGERVLHYLEIDARAQGGQIPGRQVVFLRPGLSLEPGERYIVAMRDLKTAANADVVAETAFAALRDGTPTNDLAIEERRAQMETDVFAPLVANGIDRSELVLAFDFTVQSDDQLTRQLLSMRDQAFSWLSTVENTPGLVTFTVQATTPISNCDPGDVEWKRVSGIYASPLFLTGLPVQNALQVLNVDANDMPVQNGFMDAVFDISIPCSVFDGGVTSRPLYLGHGIFGTGQGMVNSIPNQKARFADWTYIAGGTDWLGLSDRRDDATDQVWILNQILGPGVSQLNNFHAFPDRLRQGMLNALVLAKMMKLGLFNRHTAFEKAPAVGVFPGPAEEMFYYGISLGGIHGTLMAALSPDMERFGLDVPAINFSCLLQRSTQFASFELVINLIGFTDPMNFALFLGLANELWISAEPGGYATHITTDPLLGSGSAKKLYYTPSWLDKQVSNQCTEAAVRTLGLTNLTGSIQQQLADIPDAAGPVDSGVILYDPGAFDIFNPLHVPEFPKLSNTIPTNTCDPHGGPRDTPAAIRSMINFLQPGGQVENFCNGVCDAAEPLEIPDGGTCDLSSPPADQGKLCAMDADCNGGTCVAVAYCGECDAGSPLVDQGKPCDANGDCNGGTCVFATIP